MSDPLLGSMSIASSGLRAQSLRMRVVSENVANANSTSDVSGGDPYRRKTITFDSEFDRAMGVTKVAIKAIGVDRTDFKSVFSPGDIAADTNGYVKLPNVSPLIEMADLREATRSYEANLNIIEQARTMWMRTTDLINQR